jgi:hypothetical protein
MNADFVRVAEQTGAAITGVAPESAGSPPPDTPMSALSTVQRACLRVLAGRRSATTAEIAVDLYASDCRRSREATREILATLLRAGLVARRADLSMSRFNATPTGRAVALTSP